jgi:hypothetical protein
MYGDTMMSNLDDGEVAAKAYLLADKLLMPNMQNAIADRLRTKIATMAPAKAGEVWSLLPDTAPVRKLLLDKLHYEICNHPSLYQSPGTMAASMDEMFLTSPTFATKLLWVTVTKRETRNLKNPSTRTGCLYHIHENGFTCK